MGSFLPRSEASGPKGTAGGSSSSKAPAGTAPAGTALPAGVGPSLYQRRVAQLAQEVVQSPPSQSLDSTLRDCIDFCYGGGRDWAPHVRVNVYADNPAEHQSNVPVYSTLLRTWAEPGFTDLEVSCRAIRGTDVSRGHITSSPFWSRTITVRGKRVLYRQLGHQLLHWFVSLPSDDKRKQLLVNIVLQLHEACYNCIGRHKEVFEYCIYDLIDAELPQQPASETVDGAKAVVRRHADIFLDRHKRHAVHAAILAPLKFLYQGNYEVFENIDSHGASFWASTLAAAYFKDLELPYESIVELDTGWSWCAVDFLETLQRDKDGRAALERCLAKENIGFLDWRSVTAGLKSARSRAKSLPGIPPVGFRAGFRAVREEAAQPHGTLHKALRPYAERLARAMDQQVLLWRCAVLAVGGASWDAMLGPALAALTQEALGSPVGASELRHLLCGDCTDAGAIEVNTEAFSKLLRSAGVAWA